MAEDTDTPPFAPSVNEAVARRDTVPGDLAVPDAGDMVTADPRPIEAHGRQVDEARLAEVMRSDVFTRVSPEAKPTLATLQETADIGVVLDRRGTEMAKEATRMGLRDDHRIPAILDPMREGRSDRSALYRGQCGPGPGNPCWATRHGGSPLPQEHRSRRRHMSMLKVIEVLADSPDSFDAAAAAAVTQAAQTVRNIKSVYIKDMNAEVTDGRITSYRVNAKISFMVDGQSAS